MGKEYSVIDFEQYKRLENFYNLYHLQSSENKRRILLSKSSVKNMFRVFCGLCEDYIQGLQYPENYDLLLFERSFIEDVSRRDIKVSEDAPDDLKGKRILYNMYRSKTGRLTCERDSFPILNLSSEKRHFVVPHNDFFGIYDQVSADFRIFLQIFDKKSGIDKAVEKELYGNLEGEERQKKKQEIYSLLYSKSYHDYFHNIKLKETCDSLIEEEDVNFVYIKTPLKRRLKIEKERGVDFSIITPYVIQSTTSDLVFYALKNIQKIMQGKKSFVMGTIHDSFIVDWDKKEYEELKNEVTDKIHELPFVVYWKEEVSSSLEKGR
ncbi:MAG: hypothetical protein N3A54_03935 [Patescibacteria group bacterium]|nr:hypothetical protein [Patescibacteria group bacterium]